MFVRLKYYELGAEKGYTMWVRSKKEVIEKLARVGASPKDVFYLAVKKKGESDYKEYDPGVLLK
ncbi:hypothetical protein PHGAL3_0016 [Phage Altai3]|nr:hypothetical protein PHGAL3_0016 [Phage Altai3]